MCVLHICLSAVKVLVVCGFVPVVAGAADELAKGVRVGAGGLLEQPVEQQPPGLGRFAG
jgi:hypothetical protein